MSYSPIENIILLYSLVFNQLFFFFFNLSSVANFFKFTFEPIEWRIEITDTRLQC